MQSEPKRYRHKKRGTTYQVLHTGRLQVDGDLDNERVTVYRCEQDGGVWVRPDYEFNDGRFEELPSLAFPSPISADAVVEACAKVADEMRIKHGDPVKGVYKNGVWDAGVRTAAAIRALKGTFPAAPEAKSEVAVKALEWDDSCPTASVAVTPFCRYVVWPDGALSGHGKTQYLGSVPSAKAAAQADYETRVRSALVDPEGGV